jgi:E3 SUMO-protein ligase RanBP2
MFSYRLFSFKQLFSLVDTNFSWAGAGSAVFSKQQASTKGKDENDSSDDEHCADDTANSSHDPHFEPIIDLPDKIEVRTGEEDETKGWYL